MYKISYRGILKYGYVTVRFFGKKGGVTNKPPTKFRFKMIANICCWLLNKSDEEFNTFKVVKE
jgi:hypothetical protein